MRCEVGLTADRFTGCVARAVSVLTLLLRETAASLTALVLRTAVEALAPVLRTAVEALALVLRAAVEALALVLVVETLDLDALAEVLDRWVPWRLATVPDLLSTRPAWTSGLVAFPLLLAVCA